MPVTLRETNTMADEFDHKFELLKLEIQVLQDSIRSYDSVLFTIKSWAITLFSAVIFFSVQSTKPLFLVFCAVSVILFWVVDAVFKVTQREFIERYNIIQSFLQSTKFSQAIKERSFKDFVIPDLFHTTSRKKRNRLFLLVRSMFIISTAIIYVIMLVLVGLLAAVMLV
jgi:hypothetical protein